MENPQFKIINTTSCIYFFKKKLLSLPTHVKNTHTKTECPEQMNDYQLLCSMEVNIITVGSRFVTVHFTRVHLYDPCPVGPSTPELWRINVATEVSCLYLVHF